MLTSEVLIECIFGIVGDKEISCWLLCNLFTRLAFFKPDDTLKTSGLFKRLAAVLDVLALLLALLLESCWPGVVVAVGEEVIWLDKIGVVDTILRLLLVVGVLLAAVLLEGLFGILLAVFVVTSVPSKSLN